MARIIDALRELADICDDGYDTLIQDGAIDPTEISGVIDSICDAAGGESYIEDDEDEDYAVDGRGIWRMRPDGYRESIRTYRVVDRGEYLRSQIYSWKPQGHVSDLRNLLREYTAYQQDHDNAEWIDYDLISSVDIPDDVTSWPVWVADNHGDALTGNTADDIEVLADVITTYRAQRAETIADAQAETDRVTEQIRRESDQ